MFSKKFWNFVSLAALVMLPLAGCSGSSSPAKVTEKGTEVTVAGKVATGASAAKSVGKIAIAANTVEVYNAQDGATLGNATVAADGSFTGLTFTLPSTKTVLVFKATVTQGTFLSVVPVDLSAPPAAGAITGSNPISVVISQESTATAQVVSQLLGLSGDLGDAGQTLASVSKTYTDAAQLVVNNGGQQIAYGATGLALTGKFSSAALLPALDANNLSVDQLNNMELDGSITAVAIPGSKPIVSFQVTNKATGKGVRGLKSFNLAIAQLKPEANGSPSEWLSYMVTPSAVTTTNLTSLPGRPGTDAAVASIITVSAAGVTPAVTVGIEAYSVIDNGDGSYTVVFGKNIKTAAAINQGFGPTYDANLTHRLMVGIRTSPSVAVQHNGTALSNFFNEKYFLKDFVPATPAVVPAVTRDITLTASCNECHTKIGVTTPHGGRGDVKYCMMCHTAQRGYGRTASTSVSGVFTGTTYIADGEVTTDMVTMIHKIHMGNKLTKTGYNIVGILPNGIAYPKSILNCRQCHVGDTTAQLALAPQGNNWKSAPSRKSCGSCHDNINFATGANSKAGGIAHPAQADDSFCVSCHGTSGPYPVEKFHMTADKTVNNPKVADGLVNFTYDVNSVAIDATVNTSAVIKFRIMQSTNAAPTPVPVVFNGTSSNPLTGFTGGPSFLFAYSQDGSDDFTNMGHTGKKAAQPFSKSIGSLLTTLGAADSNGYYTVTVPLAFPAGSTMRTVGLQGYFTQAAGTNSIAAATARHAQSVVKTVTGDTARRVIVDGEKCGNCHEWFEGHGGNRIIGKGMAQAQNICVMCHVPGLSTSGKGADINLINFIKDGAVGTQITTVSPITNAAYTTTGTISAEAKATMAALVAALGSDPTTYPEVSNNLKDMIHSTHAGSDALIVGDLYKFVRDRGTSGVFYYDFSPFKFPGILKRCDMCHTSSATYTVLPANPAVTTVRTIGASADPNNVIKVDADRKSLPNATDLVNTPFAATCVSCHSMPKAKAHMKQNGGQLSVQRSAADPNNEACVTCHGTSGPAALWNIHRFSVVGE